MREPPLWHDPVAEIFRTGKCVEPRLFAMAGGEVLNRDITKHPWVWRAKVHFWREGFAALLLIDLNRNALVRGGRGRCQVGRLERCSGRGILPGSAPNPTDTSSKH